MTNPSNRPIGIDLGTTFTVVASLDQNGRPITIPNAGGDPTTPSAVFFDHGSILVGKPAIQAGTLRPGNLAEAVKREMGKTTFSQAIDGDFYPPEVIQSLILEKVSRDAAARGGRVKEVVITVPAYFNEPRRKATQDAGRLAGLDVIDIINEPTAAAIAYGVTAGFLDSDGQSKRSERILVYDLGGGTFDATLMAINGKSYSVLATDGDVRLGGLDWDQRIADHLAEQFQKQHGVDPRSDAIASQRLMREAEAAKRVLSSQPIANLKFELLGKSVKVALTRDQFEEMTGDLLDRTRFTLSQLVRQARLKWTDVTRVLLVGGSTRMPMVTKMLFQETGKTPDGSLAVDEAVAHGAALYAGLLSKCDIDSDEIDFTVSNVNSHNLGVLGIEPKTNRPLNCVLIPRNSTLPFTKTKRFATRRKDQRSIAVRVIEGGDASGNHSTPIGKCVIRDLPTGLPASARIEVTFTYATNGRLSVHARVPQLQREARLDIERASGMTDAMLDEWGVAIRERYRPLKIDTGL
jgi:molecular chaperone DnaK